MLQLLLAGELCLAAEYCSEVGTLWPTKCSSGQIYRFLLTRKVLALKEYFPLTSTDGPWLIRTTHTVGAQAAGGHFVQKIHMEGSRSRPVELHFMIGKYG